MYIRLINESPPPPPRQPDADVKTGTDWERLDYKNFTQWSKDCIIPDQWHAMQVRLS